MAGMLFFCMRALCCELSVPNPFQGFSNKLWQHSTTVRASAPKLAERTHIWTLESRHIWTLESKFHS